MKVMDLPSWIAFVIFPPMDAQMTFTMTILMLIASSKSNVNLLTLSISIIEWMFVTNKNNQIMQMTRPKILLRMALLL